MSPQKSIPNPREVASIRILLAPLVALWVSANLVTREVQRQALHV